jgi:hypothetical protein
MERLPVAHLEAEEKAPIDLTAEEEEDFKPVKVEPVRRDAIPTGDVPMTIYPARKESTFDGCLFAYWDPRTDEFKVVEVVN